MCCVMPPASPSATFAERTTSNSVVLPWSTWPITVTTGARGTSDAGSSRVSAITSTSSGITARTSKPSGSATPRMRSRLSVWFFVDITSCSIRFRMISLTGTSITSANASTDIPSSTSRISGASTATPASSCTRRRRRFGGAPGIAAAWYSRTAMAALRRMVCSTRAFSTRFWRLRAVLPVEPTFR